MARHDDGDAKKMFPILTFFWWIRWKLLMFIWTEFFLQPRRNVWLCLMFIKLNYVNIPTIYVNFSSMRFWILRPLNTHTQTMPPKCVIKANEHSYLCAICFRRVAMMRFYVLFFRKRERKMPQHLFSLLSVKSDRNRTP